MDIKDQTNLSAKDYELLTAKEHPNEQLKSEVKQLRKYFDTNVKKDVGLAAQKENTSELGTWLERMEDSIQAMEKAVDGNYAMTSSEQISDPYNDSQKAFHTLQTDLRNARPISLDDIKLELLEVELPEHHGPQMDFALHGMHQMDDMDEQEKVLESDLS